MLIVPIYIILIMIALLSINIIMVYIGVIHLHSWVGVIVVAIDWVHDSAGNF